MKIEKEVLPKGFDVVEEQLYYAKAKGWEHLSSSDHFWNYDTDTGKYAFANKLHSAGYMTQMTKPEWGELGINDSNADFEKVEG